MNRDARSDSAAIFRILADEYARRILVAADREPMSAKALSDACDASLTTIYRRVATLEKHGLVEERTVVDPDGVHRSEFETALERLHVELVEGDLALTLETRDELADNFTALWDDLRGES